ncbi:MAG: MFS transporter [Gemmatimonadaceae bacterium]
MPSIAARPLNPFRVLVQHRNFRIFWIGQTASLIGTWMQSVGLGWLTLEITNSAFMVGLMATASAFPVVLLSLYGGVIADRSDKLRLVTIAQALLLVEAAVLWWIVWSGHVTIGWLLGLTLLGGTIGAFEIPTRQAFIIELVTRDDLTDAIALNSGGFNLARVIGPSVAGILIHRAGIAWCFAANALSYLSVLVGLFMIRLPPRVVMRATTSPWEGLVQGLRYMNRTREVASLMRIIAVYGIFTVPYLSLMPVIARDVLHTGAGGFGLLLTSVGIGGFLGALALATIGQRVARGRLLQGSAYAFSVLLLVFSFSRSVPVAAVLLLFVGFTMILNGAQANGMLQSLIPDELRGRVMAAYAWIVVGLAPVVGPFLAGAAATRIGAAAAIGLGAAITLVYALWVFSRQPALASA